MFSSPPPFSESMDNLLSLNSVIFESLSHGNVSPVLHCYSLHPGLDHRNRPITHTPGSFIGLTQDIQSWPRWKACGPRIRGDHTHSWDFAKTLPWIWEQSFSNKENPLPEINSKTWLDVNHSVWSVKSKMIGPHVDWYINGVRISLVMLYIQQPLSYRTKQKSDISDKDHLLLIFRVPMHKYRCIFSEAIILTVKFS